MLATFTFLSVYSFLAVVFADSRLVGAFEAVMQEAEGAELKVSLINILLGREWLLTFIALNKALHFFFPRMLFQVGKDHIHLNVPNCLILGREWWVAVAFRLGVVHNHRLHPNSHILVSWVQHFSVEVVGFAAVQALLVQSCQLLQKVVAKRNVLLWVEQFVGITDFVTNFSEIGPLVFERFGPALHIVLQGSFSDLRVIAQIAIHVSYQLVSHILLFYIAQDIMVELGVEAEEHLGVVEIAAFAHTLRHWLEQVLVHLYSVHL